MGLGLCFLITDPRLFTPPPPSTCTMPLFFNGDGYTRLALVGSCGGYLCTSFWLQGRGKFIYSLWQHRRIHSVPLFGGCGGYSCTPFWKYPNNEIIFLSVLIDRFYLRFICSAALLFWRGDWGLIPWILMTLPRFFRRWCVDCETFAALKWILSTCLKSIRASGACVRLIQHRREYIIRVLVYSRYYIHHRIYNHF